MVNYSILSQHNACIEVGKDTIRMNFTINNEPYECFWPLNKEIGLQKIIYSLCGAIRHAIWKLGVVYG